MGPLFWLHAGSCHQCLWYNVACGLHDWVFGGSSPARFWMVLARGHVYLFGGHGVYRHPWVQGGYGTNSGLVLLRPLHCDVLLQCKRGGVEF